MVEIGVIGGDGIGPEVVRAGMKVLEVAAGEEPSLELGFTEFPWGCEYYLEHGRMMPEDGLDTLAAFDEIYLGAVGWPTVPDHVSLWGLLLPIRRTFDQYVNLRPARLLRGVKSPLANPNDLDITVVRENTEGEYSDSGGRVYRDTPYEIAVQESIFTRRGVERIIRYAFEEASARRGLLVGATKSNGISVTMPFFDEIFREISSDYPEVEASLMHADALAARLVLDPGSFDVVVGSNLFGDLLSEVTAAIAGAIGIAPSANLNPEGTHPSLFEPIHGSAPDIAGEGAANPAGAIWAGAMMLDHAGYPDAGTRVLNALEETLESGTKTRDLGGTATTGEMADAVVQRLGGT
ncbi:MAG: tartrate dehydrogenase [Actinomycetota bacterium]|jgi:tartrate dehydrogenase/decarboxylase/D-malate dehydrogenase|nr:tartrate dehydrogenase [Rubrobacteraceae bacterium]MBA3635816.1 tartrate dehydrogenase [Rubrobacteraceae bacterium]MBA3703577.1 tartrate dehydrogenase [Rubrobacteraceae bacterium]MDQ3184040.1 tartrate dehydrogenase [Actinomycetota bacterium]MDQ3497832.1 tartrate dehydrogenase [Actinomycetota bacterium]